jgi:hypothetical protein
MIPYLTWQDPESKNPEVRKDVTQSWKPAPRWCPRVIAKTQKRRLQKMWQREFAENKKEEERDNWFNHLWPMTRPMQTWWEKWLAKEEGGSSGDSSGKETSKVSSARGEDNLGSDDGNPDLGNYNSESGNYHSESGNRNPDSGNNNLGVRTETW